MVTCHFRDYNKKQKIEALIGLKLQGGARQLVLGQKQSLYNYSYSLLTS